LQPKQLADDGDQAVGFLLAEANRRRLPRAFRDGLEQQAGQECAVLNMDAIDERCGRDGWVCKAEIEAKGAIHENDVSVRRNRAHPIP
jgi:hypothetical protein